MPHLNLTLFGAFQADLDGQPLTNFHSSKVQGLLAYLALEAARPHPREALMALLWPDDAPRSAQQSLRQALYALRRTLGDGDTLASEPFLLVTRQTVQFNPASHFTLDVTIFLHHLGQDNLEQAVTLYQTELLAGFITDSTPFEEWLRATREYLHNLALKALSELTQRQLAASNLSQANQYARRQLALEPWREEAHHQLMTVLALGGERSAALAQYEICRRGLAEELSVEPTTETIALYNRIRAGQLTSKWEPTPSAQRSFVPVSPLVVSRRHNLPPQPTAFVGRTKDLAQIMERLDDPSCRLLTIVGPGGMGKTRLAVQAAQQILAAASMPSNLPKVNINPPNFIDGIFFVALAGVGSSDLLVSTIASVLDFTFFGSGDSKTQFLEYLRPKALLIVLDNCEHLLAGIELVSELLAAAPDVKVLATSREPLNLREEWLHPLRGMNFPTDKTVPAPLDSYTAVQLFVQCARQMKPDFDLAAEAEVVIQICRLVDGMPLGIELAATWLKFYTCPQIADEITHSLDFLTTNLRNIPARHRSIRAVFEHSWALLTPSEQKVFVRLALFHGGFQLEAAHQVADATRPLLLALVEKSLVQLTPGGRFQLHELLKQYAEEKLLAQPEELSERQKRHSHFYLTFLQQQEVTLKGREQLTALTTIEGEIENIRSAWQWALTHQDIEILSRAVDALYVFYFIRAWFKEGKNGFEQAATTFAMREPAGQQGILWGKLLAYQGLIGGWFDWTIGGPETAIKTELLFQQSVTILEALGAGEDCSCAFRGLGEYYRCFSHFEKMQTCNQQALDCAEAKGDHWEIGQSLFMTGFGHFCAGDYTAALEALQRGVRLGEVGGDAFTLSDTLNMLSRACRALGDYKAAQQAGQAALAIRTRVGNRHGMAWSQQVLGELAWRMGEYETAQRYAQASLALFTEMGLVRLQMYPLNNLGNIACSLDQLAQANVYFQRAIAIYTKADSRLTDTDACVADTMVGLAAVRLKEGRLGSGVKLLTHVLQNREAWHETKMQAERLLATLPADLVTQVEMTVDAQDPMSLITEVMTEA